MRKLIGVVGIAFAVAATAPAWAQDCPADVGAALSAACPCDAPVAAPGRVRPGVPPGAGSSWKNHGQYVKCVVHLRNDLRKAGCLDAEAKRTIAKCAARSTCGKEGAVLCCQYDTSATCSDALPGDGTAAGVCSNDAAVACDTATDCVVTIGGPKLVRHAERCTERGGVVVGGGSVCSACPLPPPAP